MFCSADWKIPLGNECMAWGGGCRKQRLRNAHRTPHSFSAQYVIYIVPCESLLQDSVKARSFSGCFLFKLIRCWAARNVHLLNKLSPLVSDCCWSYTGVSPCSFGLCAVAVQRGSEPSLCHCEERVEVEFLCQSLLNCFCLFCLYHQTKGVKFHYKEHSDFTGASVKCTHCQRHCCTLSDIKGFVFLYCIVFVFKS